MFEANGLLKGGGVYHEHLVSALHYLKNQNRIEETAQVANHLVESMFALIQPEAFKKWSEGKKVLEDEMEGFDEIVYEGESEEAYELLGIDMNEIMEAFRGQ